jgi:hypothetical protein
VRRETDTMSVQRVYRCDWRECKCHVRTAANSPPSSFILVREEDGQPRHFCTWDCLLKFAAEKPPAEVISGRAAA